MSTRRIVVLAGVLTLLGIVALAAAGRGGALDGPDGTLAFQRLVNAMGGDVSESDRPSDGATFLLLHDLRRSEEAADILRWVEDGGRIVVADPTSAIASAVGVAPDGFVSSNLLGVASLHPGCAVPEAVGVEAIEVRSVDVALSVGPPDRVGCFVTSEHAAYLVAVPHGEGRVVVLGGGSVFWNEFLDDADNAVLALRLAGGPGGDVVMGRAVPDARVPEGPWAALPSPARTVVLGLVLAAFVFVVVRWRRLGTPVVEEVRSPIPASALVDATAALLRSSADRDFVAAELREHHARRLRRRLGLPPELPAAEVGRAVDERAGADREAEVLLAGRQLGGDDELLRLARDLQRLHQRIEEPS